MKVLILMEMKKIQSEIKAKDNINSYKFINFKKKIKINKKTNHWRLYLYVRMLLVPRSKKKKKKIIHAKISKYIYFIYK